jgi:hypothetical protein
MTFSERWYNGFMIKNLKWFIRMENLHTGKRKSGTVTGDISRIVKGLAISGWIVQTYYKKV